MKDLRKVLLLTLMSVGTIFSVFAEKVITGNVKDGIGFELPGASIVVKGSTQGTITDMDGNYSITVDDNAKELVYSFVGCDSKTEKIAGRSVINVVLSESAVQLDEVVAVGYAKVKKKDLTASYVSVGSKELAIAPVTNAAQALQGKAAGVNIVSQSGAPGAGVNVVIRGGTSITQSGEPLYIVDGFQTEGGLQSIDVNDIETIDVMKDASATAIYGAQASNGVIIITTKSGKKGKTEVSYNGYVSFERLGKTLDMLSVGDYVRYQYDYAALGGKTDSWANMFGGDTSAPESIYGYVSSQYDNRAGIDWQDALFGETGILQNHNISLTGGNDNTKFLVSYNFTDQTGIMAKHGLTKNNLRARLNHQVSKRIRFELGTAFLNQHLEGGGSLNGLLKMALLQPVTGGVKFSDEQFLNSDLSDEMSKLDSQYDIYNPIIMNDAMNRDKYTRTYTMNAAVDIDILKDLAFRSAVGFSWKHQREDFWDDGRTKTAQNNKGPYGFRNNDETKKWQITNTLSYNFQIAEKHRFNALIGQETLYSESMNLDNEYHSFPENNFGLDQVGISSAYSWGSGRSSWGLVSVFGRLNYNYGDRYLLTGTVRGDGSSKFIRGNQWGFFPSASAAWRISEEAFMQDVELISNLKLRLGYGQVGNNNIESNMYATDFGSGHYAIGNVDVATLKPGNTVGNPHLKWETTTTTNIGVDIAILSGRLGMSVDLYNNESENLLIKNSIPTSTGYSYQYQNLGHIRNRGAEIVINSINFNNKNFRWATDFNIAFNRSKVISMYGDREDDYMLSSYDSRVGFKAEAGKPLGQFYGYKYDGVYTTNDFTQNADGTYMLKDGVASLKGRPRNQVKPGDIKYKAIAGDTDVNGNPIWSTNDRTVIGNALPKFTGGLNNTFAYKGFDLTVFMNFAYGNKVFNMNTQRFMGPYLPNQNSLGVMANAFRLIDPVTGAETTNLARLAELNPNQNDPKAVWSLNSDNKIAITDALDYYLEDASYLRLSTITLGYSLPKSIMKKAHISNARIYGTLNNIHTFTKYKGYDPEVTASSSALTPGVDNSAYPRAKSFVVGVNLTF